MGPRALRQSISHNSYDRTGDRPNPFFFFFQAEDGIRDVAVTGVQTCALPISKVLIDGTPVNLPGGDMNFSNLALDNVDKVEIVHGAESALYGSDAMRSEERRVGKECRSRWSPYH